MRPINAPNDAPPPDVVIQAAADPAPAAPAAPAAPPAPAAPAAPTIGTLPIVDRIDPYKKCTRNRRVVSSQYVNESDTELVPLPDIKSVAVEEREDLAIQKLVQCQKVFDFSDPLKNVKSKEVKRAALNDLLGFYSDQRLTPGDAAYAPLVGLVSSNLFRQLPPPPSPDFDPEEDEPTLELAWPHLQLVYELFLCFIEAPGFRVGVAKKLIDGGFVLNILRLFDSEDPRERDYLKTMLHRVYGRFIGLRAFIRREVNNVFLTFTYETCRFNGISELLEILGSIINGFSVPLKQEHKVFLEKVLLPLHTPRCLSLYHTQLAYCVVQFVQKDKNLVPVVFDSLFKHWPRTSISKEILFLAEMDELLESVDMPQFEVIAEPLCRQLCKSIGNDSFQVTERALQLWAQERFVVMVDTFADKLFPIIVPVLMRILDTHWNLNTRALVTGVMRIMERNNERLVDELKAEYEEMDDEEDDAENDEIWRKLEQLALDRQDREDVASGSDEL